MIVKCYKEAAIQMLREYDETVVVGKDEEDRYILTKRGYAITDGVPFDRKIDGITITSIKQMKINILDKRFSREHILDRIRHLKFDKNNDYLMRAYMMAFLELS